VKGSVERVYVMISIVSDPHALYVDPDPQPDPIPDRIQA
jgi:hypothetical protein